MADDVRLTDLEVIQQYSLAVRGETADRAELLAALKADVAWLEGTRRTATRATAPKPVVRKPAAKPTARKPAKAARR